MVTSSQQPQSVKTRKAKDLTGQTFDRWFVHGLAFIKNSVRFWDCECSCPARTRRLVNGLNLMHGRSRSCGCLLVEERQRPGRNRIHNLDVDYFTKINTEAKAYWLGFLCAEVHIWRECAVQLAISITDVGHLEKFKTDLGTDYPIYNKRPGLGIPGRAIQLCSKAMCRDLARHGIGGKSLGRTFPQDLPSHLHHHFFRGLFDGDGGICEGVTKKKGKVIRSQWTLAQCGGREIVEAFAHFARSVCGTRANILGPKSSIFYLVIHGNRVGLLLANALYEDATVYLDRKFQLYNKFRSGL